LSVFSDKEFEQFVKRAFKWLSTSEKNKIASEFERRGFKAPASIERLRIEEKAREGARKARGKTAEAMEREWRKAGCFKDSSENWEVPSELIWRSLPRGEDR
jgi:hypothetical protein